MYTTQLPISAMYVFMEAFHVVTIPGACHHVDDAHHV